MVPRNQENMQHVVCIMVAGNLNLHMYIHGMLRLVGFGKQVGAGKGQLVSRWMTVCSGVTNMSVSQ